MIKLHDYNIENISKEMADKYNANIIKEGFKRGENILFWKSKSLSLSKYLKIDGFISVVLEIHELFMKHSMRSIYRQKMMDKSKISYGNMNLTDFDIYLLNKEEAAPYIKEMIVENLNLVDQQDSIYY